MGAQKKSLPGPKGALLLGHLPDFRQDRLSFLTNCAREYGDFVSLRLGPRRIILLNHPDATEYVLVQNSRNFIKHFALRLNTNVLGNGLLSSEGEFWLRQRRLVQPAFHKHRIAAYGDMMVEHTLRLLKNWKVGEERDILKEMMELTLGIVAKALFGAEVTGEAEEVGNALAVAQTSFLNRFNSFWPLPLSIPTPRNLRLKKAIRALDRILYRFIEDRRQQKEEKDDLLSLLLRSRDESDQSQMTDRQLRDEAMTLFLAGHETTALSLSWTWYLLSQNPEAEQKLVAEIHEVLEGRIPQFSDLPRLKYTEKVVLESLRLYPPAYIMGREAVGACEIGGYSIPRGMTVLMSQWVIQRDPRFYSQPEAFCPERWGTEETKKMPRFAYFPFGGGTRRCIGDTFAMMETILVLATLAQKVRFTQSAGHVVKILPTFTLRPANGIKAYVSERVRE